MTEVETETDRGANSVHSLYPKLIPNRRWIRLLSLEAGKLGETVECALYQSDFSYPFEALSYVWGQKDNGSNVITVDGQPFTVHRNLFNALRRIRREKESRLIWVDHKENLKTAKEGL